MFNFSISKRFMTIKVINPNRDKITFQIFTGIQLSFIWNATRWLLVIDHKVVANLEWRLLSAPLLIDHTVILCSISPNPNTYLASKLD